MRMQFFGDSYDIVKHLLLKWLRHYGEWSLHPMFTHKVSAREVADYEALLGARVISQEVLLGTTDRAKYLAVAERSGNLFLDPDTGLKLKRCRSRSGEYLFADELVTLATNRPTALTMVFDHSLPRGREEPSLKAKMEHLSNKGVSCFAYVSHASFIIASIDRDLVRNVQQYVIAESHLPSERFPCVLA